MKQHKPRRPFRHLRQDDRDRLDALLAAGHTQTAIARILDVDKGTICREVTNRRRRNGRYDATNAQWKADQKRRLAKYQGMKVEGDPKLRVYVIRGLESGQSPDAISGRMRRDGEPFFASKNAIYAWLYSSWGQRYTPLLCSRRAKRRRRRGKRPKRSMIPDRISFRDVAVPITAEADQAVSSKNTAAIAVAAKRGSRFLLATKVPNHTPRAMCRAIRRLDARSPLGQTIADNGIENKGHARWGVPVCFADPHAPWQKPLVEESIGLLRRWFFPKKTTDWNRVSPRQLATAVGILNRKYRKSLGYQSAAEVEAAEEFSKQKNATGGCI